MNDSLLIAQAAPVPVTTPGGGAATIAPAAGAPATTATTGAPAAKPAQQSGDLSSTLSSFALPVLMIVVFYFLLIRPQQKREKEKQKQIKAMEKGDRVLTSGGIFGTVVTVKHEENLAVLEIADNVRVKVAVSSLSAVVDKASAA